MKNILLFPLLTKSPFCTLVWGRLWICALLFNFIENFYHYKWLIQASISYITWRGCYHQQHWSKVFVFPHLSKVLSYYTFSSWSTSLSYHFLGLPEFTLNPGLLTNALQFLGTSFQDRVFHIFFKSQMNNIFQGGIPYIFWLSISMPTANRNGLHPDAESHMLITHLQ